MKKRRFNPILFSLTLLLTMVMVMSTIHYNSSFVFGVFMGSVLLGFLLDKVDWNNRK